MIIVKIEAYATVFVHRGVYDDHWVARPNAKRIFAKSYYSDR